MCLHFAVRQYLKGKYRQKQEAKVLDPEAAKLFWSNISNDLLSEILIHLGFRSFLLASAVCTRWRNVAFSSTGKIWLKFQRKYYALISLNSLVPSVGSVVMEDVKKYIKQNYKSTVDVTSRFIY